VLNALRESQPKYQNAIIFMNVDWDKYKRHKVSTSRQIPRRSTIVLLKGDEELGRIVAGTSQTRIRELLDKAF